jgi:predicted RNase H-like HicB family nuclease
MDDIFVGAANQLIDSGNPGDKLRLAVSQQPSLYIDPNASSGVGIELDPTFVTGYVHAAQLWMQDVWRFQAETRRLQSRWSEAIIQLAGSVESIQGKLDRLTTALDQLASQRTFVVPLSTLAPEPLQLKLNIPATIEGDGDDFTATFTEANVSASGDTEADAIANLKESIVATYKILESIPVSEMSALPARQWNVLKSAITR